MKRSRIILPGGQSSVEYAPTGGGPAFITYARNASLVLRDAAAVRKFLRVAPGTPSRALLDAWITELESPAMPQSTQEAN